jgi:hypothetical protein
MKMNNQDKGLERVYDYDVTVKSKCGKFAYVGYITKNHSLKFQKYELIGDGVLSLKDKEYCMIELRDHMRIYGDSVLKLEKDKS